MMTSGLTHTLNTKNTFVHAPNRIIKEQFTPYFQNLKPLVEDWRALVKGENECRKGFKQPHQATLLSEPLTHQTIIKLLHYHIGSLPAVGPLPQT